VRAEADLRALLPELALGTLEPSLARSVEAEVARDRGLLAEYRQLEDDLAQLADAPPAPRLPRGLKGSLLQAVSLMDRLAWLGDALASLVDCSRSRALMLLRLVDEGGRWAPLFEGCELLHLRGGPATRGADVGFVRLQPGVSFPNHNHTGEERVLVLQGSYVDSTGEVVTAGRLVHAAEGTAHGLQAGPDEALVYAVVTWGVEIPGMESQPEPPESLLH